MVQTIKIVKDVPLTNVVTDIENLFSEICNKASLALLTNDYPALEITGTPPRSLLNAATLDGKPPSYYDITLHNINELYDVDTTGVSDGYILMWNELTLKWEAVESIKNLDDILNVEITNPSDKEILIYEYNTSKWINSTLSNAGIAPAIHNHDTLYSKLNHNHDDRYLKLTGGTISGNLIIGGNLTITGSTIVASNLRISGSDKAGGYFYSGVIAPSDSVRLNYDGYFYATKVYNAIYNDYAECFDSNGLVYNEVINRIVEVDNAGKLKLADEKSDRVIGVVSDSYGFLLNSSEEEIQNGSKIPVGLSGTLYIDSEDTVDESNMHRFVCSGKDGKARVVSKGESYKYEGCIVGKIIGIDKKKNRYKIIINLK